MEELNHLTQERREEVQEGTSIHTHMPQSGGILISKSLHKRISGSQQGVLTPVMESQIFLDYSQEGTRQTTIASQNKSLMIYLSPILFIMLFKRFSLSYHLIVQQLCSIFHRYVFNLQNCPTIVKPSLV